MTEPTGIPARPTGGSGPSRVSRAERELDDALYYLHEGCQPCAQRHLDLARRFGATEEQIAAVIQAGSS
jgi:Carboxymuconolactone decarboxylase family